MLQTEFGRDERNEETVIKIMKRGYTKGSISFLVIKRHWTLRLCLLSNISCLQARAKDSYSVLWTLRYGSSLLKDRFAFKREEKQIIEIHYGSFNLFLIIDKEARALSTVFFCLKRSLKIEETQKPREMQLMTLPSALLLPQIYREIMRITRGKNTRD